MITSSARSRPRGGREGEGPEILRMETDSKRMDHNSIWNWTNSWMLKWENWKFGKFPNNFRNKGFCARTYIKLEIKKRIWQERFDVTIQVSSTLPIGNLIWSPIFRVWLGSISTYWTRFHYRGMVMALVTVDLEGGEGRGGRIRRVCWYVRSAALIWFSNSVCLWGVRVIWDGCCSVIWKG